MNQSRKKKELKKYMEVHKDELRRVSADTRRFIAILLDQYEILEDGRVEVKDVCKAWDAAALVQESVETVKRWYSEFSK